MKRVLLLGCVVACIVACKTAKRSEPADVVLDPTKVPFGTREYTVRPWEESFESGFYLATIDDSRKLVGMRTDARHLAPCPKPHVVLVDADADGKRDVVFYTCGALQIFLDHGVPLGQIEPIEGERKEHHWVRPYPAKYPGIDKLVPLIHQIDPDLE